LLFVFTESFWVVLVFPAWVFLVSVLILVASFRRRPDMPDIEDAAMQTAPEAASD
jgi:hypothetical protein